MVESTIMMTKSSNKLDTSLKKKAFAFLEKLADDDSAPGLHIEPIVNSADKKVRTGRVDQGYRAVLFKLTAGGSTTYVFHGIWAHDDAIAVAKKVTLKVNPLNGVAEIRVVEPEATPVPQAAPTTLEPPSHSMPDEPIAAVPDWAFPVPVQQLVTDLGLALEVAEGAHRCDGEDELLSYAMELEDWQGHMLLNLATGMSIEDAKAELELSQTTEPVDDTDAGILKGLRHPAAKIQFAEIDGRDELKKVIEGGDFGAWRVFLHPQQSGLVSRSYNGPARVTGGAGTGKTVVLLHRARHLAKTDPGSRTVLTTFTTNLAQALSADLDRLDPGVARAKSLGQQGVYTAGVDSLAATVIKQAARDIAADVEAVLGQSRLGVIRRTQTGQAWATAIDSAAVSVPESLRSVAFFEAEYGLVILPARIRTRDEYLLVRRPGRGIRLSRRDRAAVWSVIEAYRLNTRIADTIDFGEAAAIAAHRLDRLNAKTGSRPADHVLVDEGQDLSPTHWQLLRAFVADAPNDLFIAEDGHQRIYGHRVVLSHYDIRTVGRSRRLTLNYRTTAETLAYAVSLLEGSEYLDLENEPDTTDSYRSARSGPKPTVRGFDTAAEELEFAADTVRGWLGDATSDGFAPETLAILVRDRYQRDRVVTALDELGVPVRGVDREAIRPGEPVVMTMHRAKGTEFSRVILFGLGAKAKARSDVSDADAAEAITRERSLLYVAASRARDELVATWSGPPSALIAPASDSEGT